MTNEATGPYEGPNESSTDTQTDASDPDKPLAAAGADRRPGTDESRTGGGENTVIVGLCSSGANRRVFHTDPDCPAVKNIDTPVEKPRHLLPEDHWSECDYCSGARDDSDLGSDEPYALHDALLDADEVGDIDGELLTDGGEDLEQAVFVDGRLERQATLGETGGDDDGA